MAENTMGKDFRNNKSKLILLVLLVLFLLPVRHVHASYRELELFQNGYKCYLSYQPEKAVEEFRTFLTEFPDSSAKDAVMFWLGKSFIQLKSSEEAKKIFSGIGRQFPDSPFMQYVKKEAEFLEGWVHPPDAATEKGGREDPVPAPVIIIPETEANINETTEEKEDAATAPEIIGESLSDAAAEKNGLQADSRVEETTDTVSSPETGIVYLVQIGAFRQQKKADALRSEFSKKGYRVEVNKITAPDGGELFSVIAGEFTVRKQAEAFAAELSQREKVNALVKISGIRETEQLAVTGPVGAEISRPPSEPVRQTTEVADVKAKDDEIKDEMKIPEAEIYEPPEKPERANNQIVSAETAGQEIPQSVDYPISAVSAMEKMGIGEVLWKNGNRDEDFISEQILLNEAKKLNIPFDEEKKNELVEQFNLNSAEEEYLEKFLSISALIDLKVKEIPGERMVESLSVNYKEEKKSEKAELAVELQTLARNGMPFEEISGLYPDLVSYKAVEFTDIEEWVRERIQLLKEGEVGVIWSEDGYMILKPSEMKYSFDPFENSDQQMRDEVKAYITLWLKDLRGKMAEVEE